MTGSPGVPMEAPRRTAGTLHTSCAQLPRCAFVLGIGDLPGAIRYCLAGQIAGRRFPVGPQVCATHRADLVPARQSGLIRLAYATYVDATRSRTSLFVESAHFAG